MAEQVNAFRGKPAALRGSAFDPRNPSINQPYKRLIDEGFIQELVVKFTPNGVTMTAKPDSRVSAIPDSGLTAGEDAPLGLIVAAANKGNLIPIKGKKMNKGEAKSLPLPEKSLCKRDFAGSDAELYARAQSICKENGGPALVGRVRSQNAFDGTITTSFEKWWNAAGPKKRVIALCVPSKGKELDDADIMRLANMQCPFRGTASFVVAEDEDEPKPAARTNGPAASGKSK